VRGKVEKNDGKGKVEKNDGNASYVFRDMMVK
jgi:hypothetical protein